MRKEEKSWKEHASYMLKDTEINDLVEILIGQSAAAQNVTWPHYNTTDVNRGSGLLSWFGSDLPIHHVYDDTIAVT